MIKNISKMFVLFALVLLYGCASAPSVSTMQGELAGYSLPKPAVGDKGLVYVIRPSSAGTLVRFNVFLDDQEAHSEMGYTRGNEYIYFYVTPGSHTLNSKAENWAELKVNVRAGEIVYVKQSVEVGFVMARNSLSLLGDMEGRYFVKEASLGTVTKETK